MDGARFDGPPHGPTVAQGSPRAPRSPLEPAHLKLDALRRVLQLGKPARLCFIPLCAVPPFDLTAYSVLTSSLASSQPDLLHERLQAGMHAAPGSCNTSPHSADWAIGGTTPSLSPSLLALALALSHPRAAASPTTGTSSSELPRERNAVKGLGSLEPLLLASHDSVSPSPQVCPQRPQRGSLSATRESAIGIPSTFYRSGAAAFGTRFSPSSLQESASHRCPGLAGRHQGPRVVRNIPLLIGQQVTTS